MENSQQPQHEQVPQIDVHSYKSKLQQYAQRAGLEVPIYNKTYKCSVTVDNETYESPNSFSQKKAAEQDAAKYALKCIMEKKQEIGSSINSKNTTLCKAILNEFAAKLQIERPKYNTVHTQVVPLPIFISKMEFRGASYSGGPARTKKEAEQLVAKKVAHSILDQSEEDSTLLEILRSKANLFSATQAPLDPSSAITPDEGFDSAGDEEKSKSPPPQTENVASVQTDPNEHYEVVVSQPPAVGLLMYVPSSFQNHTTPTTMQVIASSGHQVNSSGMVPGPPQNLIMAYQGCEVNCGPLQQVTAAVAPNQECSSVFCALQSPKRLRRNQRRKANKRARQNL